MYLSQMRRLIILFLFLAYSGFTQAQSSALAQNYFDQGDYEKALELYQNLYKENPNNLNTILALSATYQALGTYAQAIELLSTNDHLQQNFPHLLVELGYLYQLNHQEELAQQTYQKALKKVKQKPYFAYAIGGGFQKYNLLDYAVQTFETANKLRPSPNFKIQLAHLYGEQGKVKQMFENYVALVKKNPPLFYRLNPVFQQYIQEDPNHKANRIFKEILLKKMRSEPNVVYNNLLSWVYIQEKNFNMAFLQEKAIYLRSEKGLQGIYQLAEIAQTAKDYAVALKIWEYLIAHTKNESLKIQAQENIFEIKIQSATPKKYSKIAEEIEASLELYGLNAHTVPLQKQAAFFYAFQQDNPQKGIRLLKNTLTQKLSLFQEAEAKLALADIFVLDKKFNAALIYYTQVQTAMHNNALAQKARFKIAQTSYYKGDFDWALTQLDVLKTATSQRMANDALELSLLIRDNQQKDSTTQSLRLLAVADLFIFQQKTDSALQVLDKIYALKGKGNAIDDALLRKGKLLTEKGNYHEAARAYQKIVTDYKTGFLMDNALFQLAKLYQNHLQNLVKAKKMYGEILFNHEDSIFFSEAQKEFRKLRKLLTQNKISVKNTL